MAYDPKTVGMTIDEKRQYSAKRTGQATRVGNKRYNPDGTITYLDGGGAAPGGKPTDISGTTPSNLKEAARYYQPGGQYSKYMMAEWEKQAGKAKPTYQAGLTGRGLAGTTLAAHAAPGYGGEEKASYLRGVEATGGERLTSIYAQQEGFDISREQIKTQKDIAGAQLKAREKETAAKATAYQQTLSAQSRASQKTSQTALLASMTPTERKYYLGKARGDYKYAQHLAGLARRHSVRPGGGSW